MNKKTIIKILIAIQIYGIIWDLLKSFGYVTIRPDSVYSLLLSLALVTTLLFMSGNNYWILAFLFEGFHRASRFFASSLTQSTPSVFYVVPDQAILILIVGIICSTISTYLLFRLLQDGSFRFRGIPE
jgi:hypothetical protein